MRISHLLVFVGLVSTLSNVATAQAQGARPPAPPPPAPPPAAAPPPAPPAAAPLPAAAPPPAPPPAAATPPAATPPAATPPAAPPAAGATPAPTDAAPPAAVAPESPPAVPPPPPAAPAVVALPVEPLPPPIPAPDASTRRHDGFYLRMGLGGGFMAASVEPSVGELSARGAGLALELALGGTIADGLVIGGGLYTASASTVRWKGDALVAHTGDNTYSGKEGSLALLGLFLDYYPNPKDGFHVLGALGIGTLTFQEDNRTPAVPGETWAGGGGGAMLGVGYELWISSQWSLGGVARLLMVSGSMRGEDTDVTFDAKGYAPSLLFVATHH